MADRGQAADGRIEIAQHNPVERLAMLLNMSDEIRTFIADNEAKLKTKD